MGGGQVLLTGKPCRNFQVLVAYSMLQMVREQVLQESMTSNDILLVRAARAGPALPPGRTCDALSAVMVLIQTSSREPTASRMHQPHSYVAEGETEALL